MNNIQKAIDIKVPKKKERNISVWLFAIGGELFLAAATIRMFVLEADNLRDNDKLFMGAIVFVGVIVVAYILQAIYNLYKHISKK